uniref:Uncharacterized protein n=1 Tax=Anguilla anguilla TaxID=7936 RepID=A0A0E9P5U0_ANGAN
MCISIPLTLYMKFIKDIYISKHYI